MLMVLKTYPIQKKSLTPEYLRENTHLRARTDAIAAMVRLRGLLMRQLDRYFEVGLGASGFSQIFIPV